ncbi:alcohol dehydrogenase catalytic domain-containing protein [Sphingomonas beigongshangi]|uniref:alcohol dehydrogenase catalytic domain-containing protein n=1 Tax=Sphingomonas beigongshangi TaxID=2782540 RepID=UPI00193C7967|nr:alcohol dehydrogenase catalytic domain-containing protein [Sphingomonas beigongshangi]
MAGICGTDLRSWEKPEPSLRCCIISHQLADDVVEVGANVTAMAMGDRVLIE